MKGITKALYILAGTLILSMVAFYNGYPLVYWDSAAYLNSGIGLFVPADRPLAYGLLIRWLSGEATLWPVVLFQNLVISYLLFEVTALFFGGNMLRVAFLLITATLTFFTGAAWFSNQLMPDVFTAAAALSLFLILYGSPGTARAILCSAILVICLATHFSHLLIVTTLLAVAAAVHLFLRWRKRNSATQMKRIILAACVLVLGWLTTPAINYCVEGKFIMSKNSRAFILAHFVDNGVLKKFLDENCGNAYYKSLRLCEFRDDLPTDLSSFLWENENIFDRIGGWENGKKETDEVVYAIMTSKYFWLNLERNMMYAFIQLGRNDIGEGLLKYRQGTQMYGQLSWRMPYQVNYYLNARQNCYELDKTVFRDLNRVNLLINCLSMLALIIIFTTGFYKSADKKSLLFLVAAITLLVVNAVVMASFNAPTHRYQARVSWVLTMALLVFVVRNGSLIVASVKRLWTSIDRGSNRPLNS